MIVTIIIDDDGEETKTVVDLGNYKAVPAALRLLSAILDCPLARAYYVTVAAGINVLIEEYAKTEMAARKDDLSRILGY